MPTPSPEAITMLGIGVLAILVFSTLALQVIFSKFYEDGWRAWVPFLNGWTFFNLAGMSGAFIFTLVVPVLGTIVALMAVSRISKTLGFDAVGMTWLAFFSPTLWLLVLSVSRNKSNAEIEDLHNKKEAKRAPAQTPMTQGREWALLTTTTPPVQPVENRLVQHGYQQQNEEISFGYNRNN